MLEKKEKRPQSKRTMKKGVEEEEAAEAKKRSSLRFLSDRENHKKPFQMR